MRPHDLLNTQLEISQVFGDDTFDRRWMEVCMANVMAVVDPEDTQRIKDMAVEKWLEDPVVKDMGDDIRDGALKAQVIEVTTQMIDVVNWVALDMRDDAEFDMGLCPSAYGLVHLETPMIIGENVGQGWTVHVEWLLWMPTFGLPTRGIHLVGLTSMRRPDSHALQAPFLPAQTEMKWLFDFSDMNRDGVEVRPMERGPLLSRPSAVNKAGDLVALTEAEAELAADGSVEDVLIRFSVGRAPNMTRWLMALWIVMNQEIARVEKHYPDRALKRRLERMKIPPQVSVITLRRPANPHTHEEGESGVQWQHRWYVKGHPRWQACGPGMKEHRLIWVEGYWKGPEDAPIVQTTKVYRVAR